MVERVSSVEEVRRVTLEARRQEKIVGLVPTMGALHEGHLSLVRAARERCDVVIVSIFVNPTQFGPEEDFESYPRDTARDLELLAAEDVDFVFIPSTSEMYPKGASVEVDPGPLAARWCGASRPGHFRGVATIVAKLFNVVQPDLAFFGEKDFQQLQVIKALVRDLSFPVKVVGGPTVRERDGLALSSRNAYLDTQERISARALNLALRAAHDAYDYGMTAVSGLTGAMEDVLDKDERIHVEYAALVDPKTLEPLDGSVSGPAHALVAARIGKTRLIDNLSIVE